MNRDADGARLISNRPGNRLTDPPGCIGGELIAATILKFINGLHQANVSFLNEVQELQAAISIFLRNRNNEAEIGLNHFFLRLAGFALSLCTICTIFRNSEISSPVSVASAWISVRRSRILSFSTETNSFQPFDPNLATRITHFGSNSEPWNLSIKSSRATP